jgi:hypothetical protein
MDRDRQIKLFLRWRDQGDLKARDELWKAVTEYIWRGRRTKAITTGIHEDDELDNVIRDILAEAFQEIQQKLNQFNPSGPARFTTYCFGFVVRIAKRHRGRRWPIPISLPFPDEIDLNPANYMEVFPGSIVEQPYQPLVDDEILKQIVEAIASLPEEPKRPLRTVFCLRSGYEPDRIQKKQLVPRSKLTCEQIGAMYGYGRGWAGKKYTEAQRILERKLHKTLDDYQPDRDDQGE